MKTGTDEDLAAAARESWRRFRDTYEPLRPDLYRYCRHLSRSPWDAEDIAQDTMARAFVTLACMSEPPPNPRAWLFRVASNLWINRARRGREAPATRVPEMATASEPRLGREAAGTLIAQLSPQERAAVVLKDVFDLSLKEVAEALETTPGAIKAALHSGRSKLVDPEPAAPEPVAPRVLDAFCDAFNARDLDRLTTLLLDSTTMELPGIHVEHGIAAVREGALRSTLVGCPEGRFTPPADLRCEHRMHRGEALLLWWWNGVVNAVVRVEVEGDRIARLRSYMHAPDVVTEVCRELDVPFLTHGYRP
jgi:RNA polymerase sigma-70 factor (ECF subfamily)